MTAIEVKVQAVLAILLSTIVSVPAIADQSADREKLEAFFAKPLVTFREDRTPNGFRIIALSQLAEYCGRRGHEPCLRRTAEIALDPRVSPYGAKDLRQTELGDHGLYLAHLAIVLTEFRQRLDDKKYDEALHRIAKHLKDATTAAPHHHIASYPQNKARYPADQAAVLYALHRYDGLFQTEFSPALIRVWLSYMAGQGASLDGLHRSEIADVKPWSQLARGSALSFTIAYMSAFAPKEARVLWDRYVKRHEMSAWLLAGFREWPMGVDRPADIDSGPIVMGVGVAATAFAIAASQAVGDIDRHQRLVRTMNAVYRAGGDEALKVGRTVLSRAIALNGTAATTAAAAAF
ncbi:MAG: hypothetical protein AAF449_12440 [Myxococcota bacterium]